MKAFKLFVVFCCCTISANSFAQTGSNPQDIENDLLRIFQRINYYGAHKKEWKAIDSLKKMNSIFAYKLKYYTSKYPFTIGFKFTSLVKERLVIATSADGMFRAYSWDTKLGTVGYDFNNILQYRVDGQTLSLLKMDQPGKEAYWFPKIYTFMANNKTIYLAVYNSVMSANKAGQGIRAYAIEKGVLNGRVPMVKTPTAVLSRLYYEYSLLSVADWKAFPSIYFDNGTKTIHTPLVDYSGKMTHKLITYKFTGRFFEKVKS
ncbi:hypothetical protein [Mucilaginibacter sp.]|uniref:hypothetical protein n=1 Tax=Mucilaginibacter sp. TaxID=1882438 RepID=UPI0025F58B4B|nr:hypothetical protein [Mucilaginibacter sp.]